MRELKFRVWSVKNNCFVTNGCSMSVLLSLEYEGTINSKDIYQQYTGLTDSKGNHIFEGDIVNYKTWEGRHDGIIEENQTQVQFKDGAYYPRYINDECEDSWYSFKVYDLEVVGNVFETPHLDKNE